MNLDPEDVAQTTALRDGRLLTISTTGRLWLGEVGLPSERAALPVVRWYELKGRVLETLPRG